MSFSRVLEGWDSDFPTARCALLIYVATCLFAIFVTLRSGAIHDYEAYLQQWQNILSGADPWAQTYLGNALPPNAYGPIHVFMAGSLAIDELTAKIVMAGLTLLAPFLFLAAPLPKGDRPRAFVLALLLYTCAPIVSITVFCFGINDGFVGILILCACALQSRERLGWAGVAIGIAALLKFYPLLFAPLFAVSRSGVARVRPILTAGLTFAVGMALAWFYWGPSAFNPLLYGEARSPKHLSLLRFLDSVTENLSIERYVDFLIDTNALFVVAVASLVPLWGWLTRQGWEVTCLVGILAVFLTYKVGHPQFYVSWIAVHVWILVASNDERALAVARALIPVAVFLSLYQLLYLLSKLLTGAYFEGDLVWFRVFGSVVLGALFLWSLSRGWRALGRTNGTNEAPIRIRL